MIKKLLSIKIKSSLLAAFSGKDKSGNVKSVSGGKIALMVTLFAILGASMLLIFFSVAATLAMAFVPAGFGGLYFGLFVIISASAIFLLSIFETKAELFDCKDNDLLLSLPIKPSDIVISRIFTVLFYNYIIEAIIALPAIVCFLLFGGTPAAILGSLIVFTIVPLFATSLSAGVGYIVALLGKRFKNKTIATLILSIAFLAIYFIVYGYMINGFDAFIEGLLANAAQINGSLGFIVFIGEAALLSPLPLLVFAVVGIGISVLAYLIISKNYLAIISGGTATSKTVYRAKEHNRRSAISAITRKELSRLLSSASYMLNAATGIIFSVLLAGAVIFMRGSLLETVALLTEGLGVSAGDVISPILICAVLFVSSMNMISASALSLEGSSLWILKSMPISSRQILIAKTLPHIIVCAPIALLTGIICAVSVGAPAYYYPLYILTPIAAVVLAALFGILMNVVFPKFEFTNEAEVVKQSMPVFLGMLVPMLLAMGLIAAVLVFSLMGLGLTVSWLILALICALCVGMYFLLIGPAARKLDGISV